VWACRTPKLISDGGEVAVTAVEQFGVVPEALRGATSCRFCGSRLERTVVDLGLSPLCENVVRPAELERGEAFYPLHVRVCEHCWLVQIGEFVPPDGIFTEYAYFSANSTSWVDHAARYVDMIVDRLGLGSKSFVVELASNDGYLLQHFLPKGIPVLGIDPAANVADAARERGVPTITDFFGSELAERLVAEGPRADLVIGNNVLAQVPDLNDFVGGVATLLAPDGIATFEVPHLLHLLERVEYDTIYHEHFCYFSLSTLRAVFAAQGLALVDVDELESHGGSLRAYFAPAAAGRLPTDAVADVLEREEAAGLLTPAPYDRFSEAVRASKHALLDLLVGLRRDGKQVVGYGAPGKGNTLLNYCGIRQDFLDYTVDRNPYKQGTFTPGTRIPVYAPEKIRETRPDVILILPWNLAREISDQLAYTAEWGAQLAVPIPTATLFAPGAAPGRSAR
jgi:SAM-dependent methyltransferase